MMSMSRRQSPSVILKVEAVIVKAGILTEMRPTSVTASNTEAPIGMIMSMLRRQSPLVIQIQEAAYVAAQ